MPQKTTIEWTRSDSGEPGYTSNPIRAKDRETGKVGWSCVMVSPGCSRCYAETINGRFGTKLSYNAAGAAKAELFVNDAELTGLLKLKKTARVFLADMTDLFQDGVTDDMLDRVFAVMAVLPDLTFQVLTKRASRMAEYVGGVGRSRAVRDQVEALRPIMETIRRDWGLVSGISHGLGSGSGAYWPLPNVWKGVSCEDQARADERIPHLLRTPAAVRFLSVEPLLAHANLGLHRVAIPKHRESWPAERVDNFWIIVGGESGRGARPCDISWIRSVVDQCQEAGVPCFVKQMGANLRGYDERCWRCGHADWGCFDRRPGDEPGWSNCNVCGADSTRCRDAKGGAIGEFPEDLRIRQFPKGGPP